jgi:hypothetical protein
MLEQIGEVELAAAANGFATPAIISLTPEMLETNIGMTYEQSLAWAQGEFERLGAIPFDLRTAQDHALFQDVSMLLLAD